MYLNYKKNSVPKWHRKNRQYCELQESPLATDRIPVDQVQPTQIQYIKQLKKRGTRNVGPQSKWQITANKKCCLKSRDWVL